jgi:hypothetical protein
MRLATIALCFITSSAWADIRCSDYLTNYEHLLPTAARVLAKKAPNENRKEVNISVLHVVLEEHCKQTPERPLADVLVWFNGVLQGMYDPQDGRWIVFTENGDKSAGLGIWEFMI